MRFSTDQLNEIYDSTNGRCHLCKKKLAFKNYAAFGSRGCWEVDHSNPKAKGGTDRRNNLKPACMSCNRSKGNRTTRSVRAQNGFTKSPLSKKKRDEIKLNKVVRYGMTGIALGAPFGLLGVIVGGVGGSIFGHESDPED